MRHAKNVKKLSRTSSHRKALMKNLAIALFQYEQIETTVSKAKALRSYAEKLITKAKVDDVHHRRLVASKLNHPEVVEKLFSDIAKRYEKRPGGYTRIYRLGQRQTDGSEMVLLELVPESLD